MTRWMILTGVAAMLSATAVVDVKGGPAKTTNVTSQLQIPGDPLAPVFFSDAGQSGTDTYVTQTSGRATEVSSLLISSGDWQLDTTAAARAVWLDLGDPTVPFNAHYVHSLLTTHCGSVGSISVAQLNTIGGTTSCGMSFRINWGTNSSVFYRIHFNSVLHPGTGDIRFTCNQVTSGSCADLSAVPEDNDSMPGDHRSSGQLVSVTVAKNGSETETLVGYYQVNFQMHITKP